MVPPRASLPWRAPSTSSPTCCTWTPPTCAFKNIVREGEIMPQYYNEKLNACALDRCLLRAMDTIGWRDKPLAVDLGDRAPWVARSPCRARAFPTWISPASTCAWKRTALLRFRPAPPITEWASIMHPGADCR